MSGFLSARLGRASNIGSDVLGVLIARGGGQPFETFLAERIFEPLGMTDTGFSVSPGPVFRDFWTTAQAAVSD